MGGGEAESPRQDRCCFEMGESQQQSEGSSWSANRRRKAPTLNTAGLVALTFFSVTGGPFGQELIVKAGGPAYAILGVVVFTVLWSAPEALMTAELSAAFPEAAGFAAWTNAAYGPFAAWMDSWCSWVSGVVDNAVYPILFLDYLTYVTDVFDETGGTGHLVARWGFTLGFVAVLTYLCHRGLDLTGTSALLLTGMVLAPFGALFLAAVPNIQPSRWCRTRENHRGTVRLRPWINNLFWNVNYYDSASAWAGEVDRNKWGRAMLASLTLCAVSSLVPMLAATGASDKDYSEYHDGAYVAVARELGGNWLARWVVVAAALANVGLFVSEMSSDAYQLMGMAERGLLPACLARKSSRGTPTYAILLSALGVLALHNLTFEAIIACENLLYVVSMQLELFAYLKLRRRHHPNLDKATRTEEQQHGGSPHTPQSPTDRALASSSTSWRSEFEFVSYRGLVLLCAPASVLLLLVAAIQPLHVWLISGSLALLGVLVYYVIGKTRRTSYFQYRVLDADWTARDGIAKRFGWDDRLLDKDTHPSLDSPDAPTAQCVLHDHPHESGGGGASWGETPLLSHRSTTSALV